MSPLIPSLPSLLRMVVLPLSSASFVSMTAAAPLVVVAAAVPVAVPLEPESVFVEASKVTESEPESLKSVLMV